MIHKPHSGRKHECDSNYRWSRTRFLQMVSLSITDWKHKIFQEVKKEYETQKLFSNETDKTYGIEQDEAIGMHHLVAIFIC